MNTELFLQSSEPVHLQEGWPSQSTIQLLPQAKGFYWLEDLGRILVQEIQTGDLLFRYFIFYFFQSTTLFCKEQNEGLQSFLLLKGDLQHGPKDRNPQLFRDGDFSLIQAGESETQTTIPAGKECHVFNTYYFEESYQEWFPLFPSLQKELKKSFLKPRFFLPFPRPAKHSVLDSIREILRNGYKPQLQTVLWNLKLRQNLLTQLAQTFEEQPRPSPNPLQKRMAHEAKAIIERNIAVHYDNEQLAEMVNYSESSLKRAFALTFGIGMNEYLIQLRMEKAHQMLLDGEMVKNIAPALGMRPSQLTTDFQKYFGYKASSVQRKK